MSKKRYNNVNKRITIFVFADYAVLLLRKSSSTSLCNKRIQNFLVLLDKSMFFGRFFFLLFVLFCFFLPFFLRNGFSCLYEKYVFSPVPFLCMIFAEITFCSSINLEQPVMVSVLFFLTYQLSCGMRYLILSVPMSLLVLKEENPGSHFVQRLFFLMNSIFKYYVFSRYLYMLCILAVNVMSRRY